MVLAGEITSAARVDLAAVTREAVREIGYVDPMEPFCAVSFFVKQLVTRQAPEIAMGVDRREDQGAGDQGMMYHHPTDTRVGMV